MAVNNAKLFSLRDKLNEEIKDYQEGLVKATSPKSKKSATKKGKVGTKKKNK